MGLVSKLGRWLDTRFPEKISADEVYRSLQGYASLNDHFIVMDGKLVYITQKLQAFENGARAFEKELKAQTDEMNKAKAVIAMMQRTRVQPIIPSGEPWKR